MSFFFISNLKYLIIRRKYDKVSQSNDFANKLYIYTEKYMQNDKKMYFRIFKKNKRKSAFFFLRRGGSVLCNYYPDIISCSGKLFGMSC